MNQLNSTFCCDQIKKGWTSLFVCDSKITLELCLQITAPHLALFPTLPNQFDFLISSIFSHLKKKLSEPKMSQSLSTLQIKTHQESWLVLNWQASLKCILSDVSLGAPTVSISYRFTKSLSNTCYFIRIPGIWNFLTWPFSLMLTVTNPLLS